MSRTPVRVALVGVAVVAGLLVCLFLSPARGQEQKGKELAERAALVLKRHCFQCHGQDKAKLKGKLDLWDPKKVEDPEKGYIVPKDPAKSEILVRLKDDDMPMPPPEVKVRPQKDEIEALEEWIKAGAPSYILLKAETPKPTPTVSPEKAKALAAGAEKALKTFCYECHGKNKDDLAAGLNLWDRDRLENPAKKLVIPNAPEESKIVLRIRNQKNPMPPRDASRRPSEEERATLLKTMEDWIAAGAPSFLGEPVATPIKPVVEAVTAAKDARPLHVKVRDLFKESCAQCHEGSKPEAGLRVFDGNSLKGVVDQENPSASRLMKRIKSSGANQMPPPWSGRKPLKEADWDLVEEWIKAKMPGLEEGEIPARGTVGDTYVLQTILEDVGALRRKETAVENYRYFSLNHLLAAGATREELKRERDAFTLIINHLTWERHLERPVPIEAQEVVEKTGGGTIFRVNISDLGWDRKVYSQTVDGKAQKSAVTLFDLALLDYPYGTIYTRDPSYDLLMKDFIQQSGQVLPIAFLRADWFTNAVSRPPLYEDFMRLSHKLEDVEKRLDVRSKENVEDLKVVRAGTTVSGVSRNNRVIERHRSPVGGYYWVSHDFFASRGEQNMFRNPIDLKPAGGEMIFALPNGMQGYYVADSKGNRLEAAPTEIVADNFASDRIVRNGFSCIRCHEQGMRAIRDDVHVAVARQRGESAYRRATALRLYPGQSRVDDVLEGDRKQYLDAVKNLFKDKPPASISDTLDRVSSRYLDQPLHARIASAELGLANVDDGERDFQNGELAALGLSQLGTSGVVRRDAWEDEFDEVVRQLGSGSPIVPVDGTVRREYVRRDDLDVRLSVTRPVAKAGDLVQFSVTNKSATPIFVEMIFTSVRGRKQILMPATTQLKPGETKTFPDGTDTIKVQPGAGKDQVTVYASDKAFPEGRLLRYNPNPSEPGASVSDRIIHTFYEINAKGELTIRFDPKRLVKKTVEIETR